VKVGKTKKGRSVHAIKSSMAEARSYDTTWEEKNGWINVAYCGEYTGHPITDDATETDVTCKDCLAKLNPVVKPTLRDKFEALPSYDLEWEGRSYYDSQQMVEQKGDDSYKGWQGDWVKREDLLHLLDDEKL
jgi:hypothetical protein